MSFNRNTLTLACLEILLSGQLSLGLPKNELNQDTARSTARDAFKLPAANRRLSRTKATGEFRLGLAKPQSNRF